MLNGGNFDETRRHTVKLTLDALTYSLLSFLFGLAFFSIKSAKILFTDISIPSSLFQIISIVYFLLFFVFSAALLLPVLAEFIDQLLDWAASSVLWHILTAIPFYVSVAFTLTTLVQGGITLSTSIFSLPVEYIAAGWLAYVAVIMVTDMVKPDWREAIGNLFGGASSGNSDYLTRQLGSREDRPAPSRESEGTNMRASYSGGGGGGINWAFLLTGVFAVVVAGGFGYYYWQTTNTITARNQTIAQQQTQIAGLQTDLATSLANATSLNEQLVSNVTDLKAVSAQLASKTLELSNTQLQATNTQNSFQAQIATLTQDKATLQTQVDTNASILAMTAYTTQASGIVVSPTSATTYPVASFSVSYAGYLYITGSSSTSNSYILVSCDNINYPSVLNSTHYTFGTGGPVTVPVLPGSVSVTYGTNDATGATANLSVVYYY